MGPRFKIIKTVALIFSWVCMGLFSEVSSPTLPYLKRRVDSDYEQISRALVARSVGFLLGSLGAGIVGSKWRRLSDFWIALSLFVAGGATIAAPWCQNLATLAAMFFLDGAAKGLLAVVTSTSVMVLWKEKAAVPTHSLHFSFGVGALIAPQVARPFIPKKSPHGKKDLPNLNQSSQNQTEGYGLGASNATTWSYDLAANTTAPGLDHNLDEDRIEIVYGIMGGITLLAAFIFLFFQLTSKYRDPEHGDEGMADKRTENGGSFCDRFKQFFKNIKSPVLILCLILFIFWCLPTGAERAYGKFLFAYAVESDLALAPVSGTVLESVFWASFTAGRGLATIASTWTPPSVLLAVEIIVKIISTLLLAFLGNTNSTVLFVASGFLGATISPIFPATMVWTNLYFEMNAAMNAFAFLSAAFGAFIFSWGAGYLFQYKGPQHLMYLMVGYAVATLCIYLVMLSYLRFGKLKKRQEEQETKSAELDHLNRTDVTET